MNYSDSERVSAVLENLGLEPAKSNQNADLIVLNTCSVRQKAEDRILGLMPLFTDLKKKKGNLLIAITGCMVRKSSTKKSLVKDELVKKLSEVDLVFRIEDLAKLPALLAEIGCVKLHYDNCLSAVARSQASEGRENYFKITPKYTSKFQAFVPIMTGCDKFCAYCIVPYARGREKSRPIKEIFKECEKLVGNGCREITLLGQNVNSYGLSMLDQKSGKFKYDENQKVWPWKIQGKSPFAALLCKIDKLKSKGLKRVRWTSAHPRDMTDDVIETVAKLKTQMPYIHLPIQAGDDKVLRKMNRPYTAADYKRIIKKIRKAIPSCAVSTDIIVGFCGETKQQFENTYRLYKEIEWDMAYIARYSPRKFTLAYKTMQDNVPAGEKARRWHKLNKILTAVSRKKHKASIGKTVEVLVERCKNGICEGYSEHFKRTQFHGTKDLIGKFVKVKILKAGDWHLTGEMLRTRHK